MTLLHATAEPFAVPGGAESFLIAHLLFIGGQLILGERSLVLGVIPLLGAGSLALIKLAVAVLTHDFWTQGSGQLGRIHTP